MPKLDPLPSGYTCAGCGKSQEGKPYDWELGFPICSEECREKIIVPVVKFVHPPLP